jgi:hypothetical protein
MSCVHFVVRDPQDALGAQRLRERLEPRRQRLIEVCGAPAEQRPSNQRLRQRKWVPGGHGELDALWTGQCQREAGVGLGLAPLHEEMQDPVRSRQGRGVGLDVDPRHGPIAARPLRWRAPQREFGAKQRRRQRNGPLHPHGRAEHTVVCDALATAPIVAPIGRDTAQGRGNFAKDPTTGLHVGIGPALPGRRRDAQVELRARKLAGGGGEVIGHALQPTLPLGIFRQGERRRGTMR